MHRGSNNLERRKGHLEVELHVMNGQRIVVVFEIQAWRLLVAHGPANEQIGIFAKRTHAIFAIVQDLEIGIWRKDVVSVERAHATGVSAMRRPSRTNDGMVLPSVSSICLPHRKQRCNG